MQRSGMGIEHPGRVQRARGLPTFQAFCETVETSTHNPLERSYEPLDHPPLMMCYDRKALALFGHILIESENSSPVYLVFLV